MKTAQEQFEPIGQFMGWPRRELTCVNPVGWFINGAWVHGKTSLSPAECYEALGRLVEKGYWFSLGGGKGEFSLAVAKVGKDRVREIVDGEDYYPSQNEAIEAAILTLLKAEEEE